ncbi:MAG: tetratricopeptide repeat protein [Terracidiphilus sp.]
MSLPFFRTTSAAGVLAVAAVWCVFACASSSPARAQTDSSSSSSKQGAEEPQVQKEKAPSSLDPAGPTISLISSEPVFLMAAGLNACGYNEGLQQSEPVRQRVRDEMDQALAKSEDARAKRDKLCLFIAQHRMTGTDQDISQYISLALYLSQPPELETTVDLSQMPPDSVAVADVVPLLKDYAAAVDLHGIWLTVHHIYDEEIDQLHDPLSKIIVATDLYLKMPAETYGGRRFIIVVESMLSPGMVNARVYGTDYVVVVSPSQGKIRMSDVRHTYLHYVIEPLLYTRANAIDRTQPVLKEIREAPLPFVYRSNTVALTVECLIKAIEARTMDTKVPVYKIPAGVDRSDLPRYEREMQAYQDKMEAVRQSTVHHDMTQGYVLTQYFYEELIQFEKQPAGLSDTIGEMVYSMDVDQQVHRARNLEFDQQADEDVLQQPKPRKLTELDLAEASLEAGDIAKASSLARQALASHSDSLQSVADEARAHFILARVAAMQGRPGEAIEDFQKTLATSKEPRLLAWSHIYLGRMLDLDCKRDEALAEYKDALAVRDGAQDTRLAAERGVKAAYALPGHSCEEDADGDPQSDGPAKAGPAGAGASAVPKTP